MIRHSWLRGWLAVGLLTTLASTALADRTPSVRSEGQRARGVRQDISVPYLTNGKSAFGGYRVAPKVTSTPNVDDPSNPGARRSYNLPFYGARMGFGGTNGAVPKTTILPSGNR